MPFAVVDERQFDIEYDIEWTTLGEYLQYLEDRGISSNVASFVGATTVRIHVLGHEDRDPTPEELEQMQDLVDQAMQEGFSTSSSAIKEMGFGAGMGLPNMQKNSDKIEISSEKNQGTRVQMVFFRNLEGEKD